MMAPSHDERDLSVSFNVGGRIFVIRHSLLDAFPSTMLARSASEEWFGNDADKPIFIDRDSDRFRYCLDYMRDGRVVLPSTESKAALLAELKYFGFENVDPKAIVTRLAAGEVAKHVKEWHEKSNSEVAALTLNLTHVKQANIVFHKFAATGQTKFRFCYKEGEYDEYIFFRDFIRIDFFNEYLANYGLRVLINKKHGIGTQCVSLLIKPLEESQIE